MANIPDPTDLQRLIPTGAQPIATIRNAGAIGAAVADLGGSIGQAAKAAQEYQEKKDAAVLSSAVTGFTIDEEELRNSFDQDQDYNTMVDRYDAKARNIMAARADEIGNQKDKLRFLEVQELALARGREFIKDKAFGVEKDVFRGNLVNGLEGLREMAIKGRGEEAIAAAEQMIESHKDANFIGEEEGSKRLKDFKQDVVRGWIKSLPAPEQVDALKSDLAKDNMPTDERKMMLKEAEPMVIAQKAQDLSDKWMLDGRSDTDVQTILRNMNDEPLRTEAAARWAYDLNANKRAEAIDNRVVQDEIYDDLMAGKSLDEIDKDKLRSLPIGMENPLRVIANQNVTQIPIFSDDETVKGLQLAHQQGDYAEVDRLFVTGRHLLNKEDRKVWQAANIEGGLPDEYRVLTQAQVSMVKAMTGAGETRVKTTDDNTRLAEIELQRWYQNEQEISKDGKYPTQKQVNEYKDFLMMEPDFAPWQRDLPDTGPIYGMSELEKNRFAAIHRAYQAKYPGEVIPLEIIQRAYEEKWNTN